MSSEESAAKTQEEEAPKGNMLTRSKQFKKLVDWAFSVCNSGQQDGEVGKSELYAGLLLVHVNLAKYAGPAACYPPTRSVVDKLFEASDKDKSGGIDKEEFLDIVAACCTNLMGRILTYYAILILLVPYVAQQFIDIFKIETGSYAETAAEQVISMSFFFLAIPMLWNAIDQKSHDVAGSTKED